jgi:hypothetical protein
MPYGTVNADLVVGTNGGRISPENTFGFRNRIINGAMVIDQRNAGASVSATTAQLYSVDRWKAQATVNSKYTFQQNAGSVTPPVGFSNYLGITSSSAYAVTSTDNFALQQWIEGYNIADLGFGTANAKTVTLSFWVYSSLTGTFGGALNGYNGSTFRSYPFTYTISSASTWTQISITIPGDTTTFAYNTTNSYGLSIQIGLGVGSTNSATAGSWQSGNYSSATGATSVVGTNGATFYITGVQLEVGSNATSFEYRDIGRELLMCQRYFQKSYNQGTAPGSAVNIGTEWFTISSYTGRIATTTRFAVPMRASPSVIPYDWAGTANRVRTSAGNGQTGYVINGPSENNFGIDYTSGGISELLYQWSASVEL